MSDDTIQITVDGQSLTARKGQMLIEVTDAAGIDIPRFCYHRKLSIAANCRMCLVEVEKAPKPLPACATPVMPDMVVKTHSKIAREAQQSTMEFLLINHPLDCPVCDQGGECELQDVAMGYGKSAGQYTEGKRVVFDKYIGPLIATEMTRCIHCTRCVRFGEEIAGVRELGATGRGEHMRIGTYIEKAVVSELSGNVIDICPVGALTARPSRFTARSWELRQQPSVSPHDSVGSNIYVHLDGHRVNRVIPRDNEAINEVWIADRDRFSYRGLNAPDRLTRPLLRTDGVLAEATWPDALAAAAARLRKAGDDLGVLVSASLPLEELYLAQKLGRSLGSPHIDHRLAQVDFALQDHAPVMPWLGMQFADLETLDAALLIGSNIRKDQPIAALRLRKSALAGGAISLLNPRAFPLHFEAADTLTVRHDRMLGELIAIGRAAGADLKGLSNLPSVEPGEAHRRIAATLAHGKRAAVMLGNIAVQHPALSALRFVATRLATATGATLSLLPERANTAGAWLAGALPHREAGGRDAARRGRHAAALLADPPAAWLLVGTELEYDAANPRQALTALREAGAVVAIASYLSESLREHADVILPAATFTETYGTWVNAAGSWQSVRGFVPPPGEARPAWKIFRVLAESLELDAFAYDSPEAITRELQSACAGLELTNLVRLPDALPCPGNEADALLRAGEIPIYATDPIVRRATPLLHTRDGRQALARMAGAELERRSLADGDRVTLAQNGASVSLEVRRDDGVPEGSVWLPSGLPETAALGALFAPIEIVTS